MKQKKATGYDKYIDWKIFSLPVVLLSAILIMPPTAGMRDVGVEYALGGKTVINHLSKILFEKESSEDLEQWQLLACQVMEQSIQMGANSRDRFLSRDLKWCRANKIPASRKNLEAALAFIRAHPEYGVKENEAADQEARQKFAAMMSEARAQRYEVLHYDDLSADDKKKADQGVWKLKVSLAMMAFVVLCFVTACIPLPAVAFCIGLLLVFTGVVTRTEVAALYWSDACWFIMGSLMFAAAFVKTGVDKRICLFLFDKLARPSVAAVTLVMVIVIAPVASFISDHALAAIFLPIAIILHRGSQGMEKIPDMELGKMLVITVAMACNIGGFGSPSGGARNVIMMTYLNDMFGIDIGYFQWMIYAMPFVIIMIPITWLALRWRFKPQVRDLSPAMNYLKQDIAKMGKWNRDQILALVIFLVMIFFWFTEKTFYDKGIFPVRLGIGVIAIAGAVAYIISGVVNWRDYQERVDWGVIWLYAGAIIFGKVLDESGAAYFIARSAVDFMGRFGMNEGVPLIGLASVLTGGITQIMADGPAAASVGPITLNMAGIAHPGTQMLPFMALATACASSFAYCLIIGTPPNAIVYASGYLEPRDYLRVGIPLWFAANIVLLLMASTYWRILGFPGLERFPVF